MTLLSPSLNVIFEQVAFLFYIQGALGSNHNPHIGHYEQCLSWFSFVLQGKSWDGILKHTTNIFTFIFHNDPTV
jgi:hypothetical protein